MVGRRNVQGKLSGSLRAGPSNQNPGCLRLFVCVDPSERLCRLYTERPTLRNADCVYPPTGKRIRLKREHTVFVSAIALDIRVTLRHRHDRHRLDWILLPVYCVHSAGRKTFPLDINLPLGHSAALHCHLNAK